MRRALAPSLLVALTQLAGCWQLELTELDTSIVPFLPEVGAPDGWVVESYDMSLTCVDGTPARFHLLYPEEAAADPQRVQVPLAILFHSGAYDYVLTASPEDPIDGTSFQQSLGGQKRLTSGWAFEHTMATLGLYPNYVRDELHAGALPAALAEKGIAVMIPTNCWGDWWHNRQSVEQNNFSGDFFLRDGRTAAEFAWLHATTSFPPGRPVELPIGIDTSRIYLVGLGTGTRAVSELLSLRQNVDGVPGPFLYRPAAVVLDSPTDDLRVFYDNDNQLFDQIQSGLFRIFPGGRDTVVRGSMSSVPQGNFPQRIGVLLAAGSAWSPEASNDNLLAQLTNNQPDEPWLYRATGNQYVLSNANVRLAKAVADFLVDGPDAVPEDLRSEP